MSCNATNRSRIVGDFRYVDIALQDLYSNAIEHNAGDDLVVKLFGGARMFDMNDWGKGLLMVGDQNITKAKTVWLL